MYDQIITLIKETNPVNSYGDIEKATTTRDVFCDVRSIGTREFYESQGKGPKPELKFVLPDYMEYQNEQKVSYQDITDRSPKTYDVIRTYRNGNELEITVSKGIT